ncbi:CDP-diacylglycerol--serine O-phosphatidyltransferase [Carboxydothermus hydrogenoformans]|uniref:CDP-diacylglycerol--serine O-phosphatidyltransferase n=1 Tax=Carboxydothermus hydrogenoformans (strain ATCC BAA-161 / DSM 6008 / Z-2901) TaxID=246194 RepID=Q3ADL5_CARHZ|nr:CDP-diacylglycerol--serine O-phosphatidyltransferase [Carboxydothermus hydrogenoformans]ABB14343.1 CDP-diacylglycerol--serine O-phosphatidyltransferase [Carboxydothermus hydrogenoformans Z-2901]
MILRAIPSVCTLLNLAMGMLSIIATINENYLLAAVLILISVFSDGIDGRLARRFAVASDFGKQLDSLADLVSFGVAPALLVYADSLSGYGYIGLFIIVVYTMAGAWRLARFNILDITGYFIGVPITFAGGFTAVLVLLSLKLAAFPPVAFLVITPLLAYLMVSRIKVPKY